MKSVSFSQEALKSRLDDVVDQHVWGTVGPESKAAAKEFAALLGCEAALLVASHASGAETVLRALEVSFGDEVVLPACCSPFLKEAVEAVGAKCVFCEVDDTLSLRADDLARVLSERTQAVFCEEALGYPADIRAVGAVTRAHDLPLIDVSPSPYCTRIEGRPTVCYADVALCTLPFENTAVLLTREEFIGKLYAAHHCGNPYGHPGGLNTGICLGGDMRIDEFRSAILRELIPQSEERRRAKNSLRIRLVEALIQDGAEVIRPRPKADSAGDFVLCSILGKESCRDRADAIPLCANTDLSRAALLNLRAYRTCPQTTK